MLFSISLRIVVLLVCEPWYDVDDYRQGIVIRQDTILRLLNCDKLVLKYGHILLI